MSICFLFTAASPVPGTFPLFHDRIWLPPSQLCPPEEQLQACAQGAAEVRTVATGHFLYFASFLQTWHAAVHTTLPQFRQLLGRRLDGTYLAAAVQEPPCPPGKPPRYRRQLWGSKKPRNIPIRSSVAVFLMCLTLNIKWIAWMVIFQHRIPESQISKGSSYITQYKS